MVYVPSKVLDVNIAYESLSKKKEVNFDLSDYTESSSNLPHMFSKAWKLAFCGLAWCRNTEKKHNLG